MKSILIALVLPFFFLGIGPVSASEEVTLAWDAVDPAPSGYRIYMRTAGQDYAVPVWEGTETTAKVMVPDGIEVAFVARAFAVGGITGEVHESGNSNEITYMAPPPSPGNLLIQAIENLIEALKEVSSALKAG